MIGIGTPISHSRIPFPMSLSIQFVVESKRVARRVVPREGKVRVANTD